MFARVTATAEEKATALPGDKLVPGAMVIMDRAFTLPGSPSTVWPWFNQLGKNRSGWYLPRSVERCIPRKNRALRHIEPTLQNLKLGTIIDDWGGKHATFKVAIFEPPHTLVHTSKRGNTHLSWAITLHAESESSTRVHLRLRLAPVGHKWLARSVGALFDLVTIAGLAAGLNERLR